MSGNARGCTRISPGGTKQHRCTRQASCTTSTVNELLRPGGVLYLVEIHPTVVGLMGDGRTISFDIIDADYVEWQEKGGTYAAPDARFDNTVTFERAHSLGDVVTAVLDAGFVLELLHEQSFTNVPWPWTVRGEDGYYRLPAGWPRYPLTYSLRARRGTGDR